MADNRGLLGDSWAFTEALGDGVWDAGTGMVKGLGDLAKGGYKLATDANARKSAWETTKQLADAAADYSKSVIENPGEAYLYARDGTLAAYDRFEEAKDLAAAEGRSAEFFGDMAGGALFEVGSILVPVGLVAKAGKLGKVASVADDVADAAKAAKKVENAEDVLGATQKAKAASVNPVINEFDDKVSPIQRCPVADSDVGVKNVNDLKIRNATDKPTKGDDISTSGTGLEQKGTVFSGHGAHSNQVTKVPEGTSVTVYSGPGGSITDRLGNKIETGGDLTKVTKKTYGSGELMPDNILYEPKGLDIKGNPVTVEKPTTLSEMLKPDMGECHWAACTSAAKEKFSDVVFDIDGVYKDGVKIKSYD